MKGRSLIWIFGFMLTATAAAAILMFGMINDQSSTHRQSPAVEMNHQRESHGVFTNDPVQQSETKAFYQQHNSDIHVVAAYPDVNVYEALMYLPSNTDSLSVSCDKKTFGVIVSDVPSMAQSIYNQCGLVPGTFMMYYHLK